MRFIVVVVMALLSLACSKQGVYQSVQDGGKTECQKYFGDEYDRCAEKYSKPYGEYQQDREEAIK